jgi:long-chain acyl-CoA synthetase
MMPTHLFLYQHLYHAALTWPDKPAVRDRTHQLTFGQLHVMALQVARVLMQSGVCKGDRVVLVMANTSDFVRAYWGAIYAGAVVTPLSPETPVEKLGWIIGVNSP